MNIVLRRIGRQFSTRKDYVFEFNQSYITLCARVKNLEKFTNEDFDVLDNLKVRRILYNLNADEEVLDVIAEKHDEALSKFFSPDYLLFALVKGFQFNLPVVIDEKELINKMDFKALLQVSQHLISLKPKKHPHLFQVFMQLDAPPKFVINEQNEEDVFQNLKENFDALDTILANSFNFKINKILKYYTKANIDRIFQIANLHPGFLKSVDLDLYKYANTDLSEIEMNREILSRIYSNGSETYNTFFLKNFTYQGSEWKLQDKLLEDGIVSYQHLNDMFKLLNFKGSLVVDYDRRFVQNINAITNWMQQNSYRQIEKSEVSDSHELDLDDGQVDTNSYDIE